MKDQARYCIGIDLGTTHSVLSYVDLQPETDQDSETDQGSETPTHVEVMPIPQMITPGNVESLMQLGSFIYQAHEQEIAPGDKALPWTDKPTALIGAIARRLGSHTPIRLIASAKSWLCHGGVDRREAFLPSGSLEEVEKLSPLKATALYLEHLRDAWNYHFPQFSLETQDVTITIPASFDPAARELTAEAATEIGINHLTLLEEPQAALYSWIDASGDVWRDNVTVGDMVLVIDIGGGTTDLSLVAVKEDEGNLVLERVAVGEHILLGGDNMDLALAYQLKNKLAQENHQLQPWQIQVLTHACRDAKESLLSDSNLESVPIVVPSRSSKLLGGTLKTELLRDEVQQTLVDGFFPRVSIQDHPVQRNRGALTQMGLPYAQDAGITRHIAAFLSRQTFLSKQLSADGASSQTQPSENDDTAPTFIHPSVILLNGGVLKSSLLAERLLATVNQWLTDAGSAPAKKLTGTDLDLAVARGAAYYGSVRLAGGGVRIRGGLASAYYVGIESAMPAVPGMPPIMEAICVAPFGMEEGTGLHMGHHEFGLVIGQPVHFQFFGSTVRRNDQAGTRLESWWEEELQELPEIQVTLPISEGRNEGEVVPVTLASHVTEIGTLCLEAIAADNGQKWHVEFDVRKDAVQEQPEP
jgi:molecular chaperone DnaK (HSP70)